MTGAGWHISVLIPARDEEVLLPRCLHSVLCARRALPVSVSCSVVVVVDNSTDSSGQLAGDLLRHRGTVLYSAAGVVGTARRLAAEAAIAKHAGPHSHHWLAHTDADCRVPSDWLLDQLSFAKEGFEAAAGIVDVDSFDEHGPEVLPRFRESYRIERDGTHPHVHGANLGLRADAYLKAGGWRDLPTAEDHDLWGRLRVTGARILSTTRGTVVTSGRRCGRAPNGFAEALALHNETAA